MSEPSEIDRGSAPRFDRQSFRANAARRDFDIWTRLNLGFWLLVVGTLFWLDRIGSIDAHEYLRWWPVALIVHGLAHLPSRRWVATLIFVILGLAFMPRVPFLLGYRPGDIIGLWPLLIAVAGVSAVMQALRPTAKDAPGGSAFRAVALMGGNGRVVGADPFRGGDIAALMGAAEIDLTHARIAGEAVIDIVVFWGGAEIVVPEGWQIESHCVVLLGGLAVRTSAPASPDAPRLILRGSVIMGGVEIRNPRGGQ